MAKRKKHRQPRHSKYRDATAFDVATEVGRGGLLLQRIQRAWDMLDLDIRARKRAAAMGYVDGSYAAAAHGEQVYLNEALPALEDMIFGTVPALPPVQVEARQMWHDDLADAVASLVDATLSSGLCRALKSFVRAEWDELSWGVAFLKTAWHEEDRPANSRSTQSTEFLIPHVQMALWENENPKRAVVGEADDDAVHLQVHQQAMDPTVLEDHMRAHYARVGRQRFSYPVVSCVSPDHFVYEPDTEDWEEVGWCAELCDELVTDLEQLPGVKNLNPENCPSTDEFDNSNSQDAKAPNNGFDFEKTRVRVWKIHDRSNGGFIILPASQSGIEVKPLIEDDWPYGSLDIYRPLVHRTAPGRIHGYETLGLILPILDELARTNASIRRHNRRGANAKMVGIRGEVDTQFESDLADPDKPIAYGPAQAVATMQKFDPPTVPRELIDYRDMLLSELRRMVGSDIMAQGGDTPHEISATEADYRGQFQGDRLTRRKQEVSEVLSWAARNVVLLYRDWADEEIPVRVMGPEGAIIKSLDPSSIPADLTVTLDIEAVTEAKRAQDMQGKLVLIDKMMTYLPQMANPVELMRMLFAAFGVRNPDKYFITPQEQTMAGAPSGGSTGTIQFPKDRAVRSGVRPVTNKQQDSQTG